MRIRFGTVLRIKDQGNCVVIDVSQGDNVEIAGYVKIDGRLSLGISGGMPLKQIEGVVGEKTFNQIKLMYMNKFGHKEATGKFYEILEDLANKEAREIS